MKARSRNAFKNQTGENHCPNTVVLLNFIANRTGEIQYSNSNARFNLPENPFNN
jgi:hypothetical protein